MNITTEPIRDKKKIKELLSYLKGTNPRNYLMAKVQLNTARRISDVLKFKVSDFFHSDFKPKEYLTLYEKKTDKETRIAINEALSMAVKEYLLYSNLAYDDYLFLGKKSKTKPISTTQAHRIFDDAAKALHIENFNSHSLRKTWGYFAYKKTQNIALIMEVYNHSSEKETLKYIGITQHDKNILYKKITF